MYLRFLKDDGTDYSDRDLPGIATALLNGEELTINCTVVQKCKNLGLYLTESSSLGDYRFQPDISRNNLDLLAFESDNEPDSGLSVSSTWNETNDANEVIPGERDYTIFSVSAGADYTNRILVGPENYEMAVGYSISIKLKFKPSELVLKDKRIFIGIEADAIAATEENSET